MNKSTQDKNIIKIDTSLGKDTLYLTKFTINEALSSPFVINISCFSNGEVISQKDIIGKSVSINLSYKNGLLPEKRYFNGVVERVKGLGSRVPNEAEGHLYRDYELRIVPALEFSKYRNNSRIFQSKTVQQIIEMLLSEHCVQHQFELTQSYLPYRYKVQYNESDFQFVQRLLQEAGIFYFFEHTASGHTMVLCDAVTSYRQAQQTPVVFTTGSMSKPHIHAWQDLLELHCGKAQSIGYTFEQPSAKLLGLSENTELASLQRRTEWFNYVAEGEQCKQVQDYNDILLESLQNSQQQYRGSSTCASYSIGKMFSFEDHEDETFDGRSFVISEFEMVVSVSNQLGASQSSEQVVYNHFTCLDSKQLFRASIDCDKPIIHGMQTALVTGDEGEELHVDKYGRIKVLFHWDREGEANSNSSCWIRVAQGWAGPGFGAQFLPRVGHEVLVTFLEGDPDQPLVTGSVYNGANAYPYSLPADKYHSGIKSRSLTGGNSETFNELRLEDEKGKELVYLQAEKDLQTKIKNDQFESIANNVRVDVGNDVTQSVGNNRTQTVGNDLVIDVSNNTQLQSGGSITIKNGGASITLSNSGNIDIKGNAININGSKIALTAGKISLN